MRLEFAGHLTRGGEGAIDLVLILPGSLGLLKSRSDVEALRLAFQNSGRWELSSSAKMYPEELEAVYSAIGDFFGAGKMYMQMVKYEGEYKFEDDLVLDVSGIGPYAYKHGTSTYGHSWFGSMGQLLTADEAEDASEAHAQNNSQWIIDLWMIVEVLDSVDIGDRE